MSHGHKHADHNEEIHQRENGHHKASGKKWHRDWRVVGAAILMLVAISIYVLTMDFSMLPGRHSARISQPAQTIPAALP